MIPHRAVACLLALVACGENGIVDPGPEPAPEPPASRADLTVTAAVAAGDAQLAVLVGLAPDGLAGAVVTARHARDRQEPQAGVTDAAGRAVLPGLVEGEWVVVVRRKLTDGERAALPAPDSGVTGFGGGGSVTLSGETPGAVTVEAPAVEGQGSLVISEVHTPVIDEPAVYWVAQYVEVHNNSFDTLYLDGKVLGLMSISLAFDTPTLPCADKAEWREDPDGIWTREFYLFPGVGRDYPLAPGASALLATNAVDHRVEHTELLDLSRADFEFIGVADGADENPDVPNMRNLWEFSRSDGPLPVLYGLHLTGDVALFLADTVDVDGLVRDSLPTAGQATHVRMPGDRILDVVTIGHLPGSPFRPTYCGTFVHPSFDGAFAELVDRGALGYSMARRAVAGVHPALRLLQRTRSSATDFTRVSPSPGRAP